MSQFPFKIVVENVLVVEIFLEISLIKKLSKYFLQLSIINTNYFQSTTL